MKWGIRHFLVAAAVSLSCLFGFAAVGDAAPQGKPLSLTKYTKHHKPKKAARHHSHHRKAVKTSANSYSSETAGNDKADAKPIASDVANARAELNNGNEQTKTIAPAAMIAPASSGLTESDKAASLPSSNGVPVTTSDQLNDIDRAAAFEAAPDAAKTAATPIQSTVTAANSPPPVEQLANTSAVSSEEAGLSHSGAWDSASLIGKIFIGIGLMLTLASAARFMFA